MEMISIWADEISLKLVELAVGEVHLGMSFHELLQRVLLLLLVAGGFAHLLLPLVVHHLLHHASRLPVKVAQLAVLRLHLWSKDGDVLNGLVFRDKPSWC